METYKPQTPEEAREAVSGALAESVSLEVVGAGSKRDWGRPLDCAALLDMSAIAGILLYEPGELVISAGAGTPLAEIEAALAEHGQQLGFEPADYGPLLGGAADRATLGGVMACNLSGPRRIQAGAARDHFLGFEAIGGRGESFKGGGRVVKNVTGFDMAKLLCGSFGTLAILTSITLKAVPAPEEARTILVSGLSGEEAIAVLIRALGSPFDPSGAAHLPESVAGASLVPTVARAGSPLTALRIEGHAPSVAARADGLCALLKGDGRIDQLRGEETHRFWREVRDVLPFARRLETQLWRLSVPPAAGARVAGEILREVEGELFHDWGGGLIWLSIEPEEDAAQGSVRRAMEPCGGHAPLVRASREVRAKVSVFQPQPAGVHRLTARIKENFDPRAMLNPGRMFEDL
ncbi:MAG: glycolate oxidase subunit GlcE [Proteobacteria bacterium]|nr:glycolate oxidase subunit GlcE [Pseudomonadota bacterium]